MSFNNIEVKQKLYHNIADINFYEVNFEKKLIIINISKSFMSKYGLNEDEIILKVNKFMNYVHKEYKKVIYNYHELLINSDVNTQVSFEFRIKYPNMNNYCWFKTVVEKKSEHLFYGVQIDITDLKETELKLKETKENYEVIVNNATDLIVKYNLNGEIIYASPSYCKMFNVCQDEIINKNYHEFDKCLSVNSNNWYKEVLEPPFYKSQNLICINKADEEDVWISWANNSVIVDNKIKYIISVGHDVTEIIDINKKLEYQLNHDILTGLYNRRGIYNELKKIKTNNRIVSFFIDINKFKYINDFYGHKTGDAVLIKIGNLLKQFEKYGCTVGRLSGDEFIIFIPNFDNASLNLIKSRLIKTLNGKIKVNNTLLYVSCSFGYAIYPDDTNDFETLISYSDLAMYDAKSSLNNKRCKRFNIKMFNQLKKHINISNDLREYINNKAIDVVYQNVVDCNDLSVKYIEGLARWNHNTQGFISPDTFFDIAEKSGIVEDLDYYIIKRAFLEYKVIKQLTQFKNTIISINVMPSTLLNPVFPRRLKEVIKYYELSNQDICIEINEKTFVNNINDCIKQIAKLKKTGVLIALDDFGNKYSSLAILDKVEFDIIKTDRNFIKNINEKPLIKVILKMLKEITQLSEKDIIIEGVETKEQSDFLQKLGFNLLQGFYYSKPDKIKILK